MGTEERGGRRKREKKRENQSKKEVKLKKIKFDFRRIIKMERLW